MTVLSDKRQVASPRLRRSRQGKGKQTPPSQKPVAESTAGYLCKTLTILTVLVVIPILFSEAHMDSFHYVKAQLRAHVWGTLFVLAGEFFFAVNLAAFLWRLWLVWRYRPTAECSDAELPSCTVIVPAYNEGQQVSVTLRSLLRSDYPAEKIQIIAVDDGSQDDTWKWIRSLARRFPDRILAIRQGVNRGKRHALHEGFRQATGEVLVTVDSDCLVERQTLRRLMGPIVRDPKVAAVAGNVRVLNRQAGLIPRMLDVRFVYSFDFMRASQSMVNSVICTAGALSAYRRDVVEQVLPDWMNQTFLRLPAVTGEDRAMTNLILRAGYHVHFQQDAVVYTNVPTDYTGLCKMFLRWARSNYRETWEMGKFVFRNFRETPKWGARVNFFLQGIALTFSQLFFIVGLACLVWKPMIFGITLLGGIAIRSIAPAALYYWRHRHSDALLAFLYGVIWCFALSWITPYASMSLRKTGWLTRQKSPSFVAKKGSWRRSLVYPKAS